MNAKTLVRIIAVLAVVALTIPAMAKPITRNITVTSPAKIGSAQLEIGSYKLVIDDEHVIVRQDRETVVETRGRWETRDTKYSRNSLIVGPDRQVREIRFAGKREVLILE
jgi:hypothetical protein